MPSDIAVPRIASVLIFAALALVTGCVGGASDAKSAGPTITSSAPTSAQEGQLYSYTLQAQDAAGASVSFALTASPPGAVLGGGTLTWTPTHAQSRVNHTFTVSATSSGRTTTQTWTLIPAGTIHGTRVDTFVTSDGRIAKVPVDLSSTPMRALVPTPARSYTEYPGKGYADGSFAIPGVPGGEYFLNWGSRYDQTATSDPQLGIVRPGRPDATNGTYALSFDLAGLSPSLEGATALVEWWVPDLPNGGNQYGYSGAIGSVKDGKITTPPSLFYAPLMDASRGDRAYALVRVPDPAFRNPQSLAPATHALGPLALTTTANTNFPIAGTLQPMNRDASFDIAVPVSEFAALRPEFSGTSITFGMDLMIYTDLTTPDFGPLTKGPVVFTYSARDLVQPDWNVPGQHVAKLLPSDTLSYCVEDHAYSAQTAFAVPYLVLSCTRTPPSLGSPAAPVIGPVRNPRIESATLDLTRITPVSTTTPAISWTPPAVGVPSHYQVDVLSYPGDAGAEFFTQDTQVRLPSGILKPGDQALVQIVALDNPAADGNTSGRWAPGLDGNGAALVTMIQVAGSPSSAQKPAPHARTTRTPTLFDRYNQIRISRRPVESFIPQHASPTRRF